jgi:hypothetical protein
MKNLFATMVMATLLAGALQGQSLRAYIRDIRGTVEIKAPGSSVWQAAKPGQALESETMVSTGFQSAALIAIGESTIQAQPLTRLSLGELQAAAGTERIDIHLRAGRIRAEVEAPAAGGVDFTVRSARATASVRGTLFDFDTRNLRVTEGTVSFSGADGIVVYVAAGQSSSTDPVSGRTRAPAGTADALAPPAPAGAGDAAGLPPPLRRPESDAPVNVGVNWD